MPPRSREIQRVPPAPETSQVRALRRRLDETAQRLEEATQTLEAIRTGAVDAVVVSGPEGERIFSLHGAEQSYRLLVETVNAGALTVGLDGLVLYANRQAATLLHVPLEQLLGTPLERFIVADDLPVLRDLFRLAEAGETSGEVRLQPNGGVGLAVHLALRRLDTGDLRAVCIVATDLTERKQAEAALRRANESLEARVEERTATRELLIRELNHRVKNTLVLVQALATQTAQSAPSPEAFVAAFTDRLLALASTHDLLTSSHWGDVGIQAVVDTAVTAHGGAHRIAAGGDAVLLQPKAALAVSLALHELATNATKYGALSVPAGRIALTWGRERVDGTETVVLDWREEGGPPVVQPSRKGFGLRLLERGLRQELGGAVTIDFLPAGVRCSMRVPLGGPQGG